MTLPDHKIQVFVLMSVEWANENYLSTPRIRMHHQMPGLYT
jgi:hypothetical protein